MKQTLRAFYFMVTLCVCNLAAAKVPKHLFLTSPPPVALPRAAADLVNWETRFNPVEVRPSEPFWIEHLEIPLSALNMDKADNLDLRIHKSLVFKKGGVDYVRWILNPEDTQYGAELEAHLKERGISFVRGQYFIGYLTASRSCIVQDPQSAVVFSIKASTNVTGGSWRDKKETARAAKAARLMSDYLSSNFDLSKNRALRFLPETLSFTFGPADQAVVVREYPFFNDPSSKVRLVPGFTIVHESEGKRLARLNGSADPDNFWKQNMVQRLGVATAESVANYGVTSNSYHSQNYLVALDEHFRPTGLIYNRDAADAYLNEEIILANRGTAMLQHYKSFDSPNDNKIYANAFMEVVIGTNKEMQDVMPSWQQKDSHWNPSLWQAAFQSSFQRRLESFFGGGGKFDSFLLDGYQLLTVDYDHTQGFKKHLQSLSSSAGVSKSQRLSDQLNQAKSAEHFLRILKSYSYSTEQLAKIAATKTAVFERLNPSLSEQREFITLYPNPLLRQKWQRTSNTKIQQCLDFL